MLFSSSLYEGATGEQQLLSLRARGNVAMLLSSSIYKGATGEPQPAYRREQEGM